MIVQEPRPDSYDAANRLLSKTPDPSFGAPAVTYTYFATGLRHTMTDASGTTTYVQYDNRGRLTQVSKPAGLLNYTYDLAGNLTQLSAPTVATYTYDALNRLSTVMFRDSVGNPLTSTYAYDNVGNLQSVTYPNGVVHAYTYDTRNRLTNLAVNNSTAPIESYAYTLDAAGHRLSVSELFGRTVNYGYDSIYRLSSETIASDPHGINGAVNYTYDPVGNRKQMTSTLAPVPAGLWNYDANDRFTAGDTYDANGNTVSSGGIAAVYDFENHLIQKAGVTIVYDGDGNRVSKTVAGITTTYLVDTLNPTGYAQVVYESFTGGTAGNREQNHSYVYGLELISQVRTYQASFNNITQRIYYVYDGHGSVRALSDPTGAVTDTYDYDAFGNVIHSSTTLSSPTLNNYLFAGEQFDPDLNLYYNRARYLNVSTGRFWSMDNLEGSPQDPPSLHKYLFAEADPIDNRDPSGNEIDELIGSFTVAAAISTMPTLQPLAYGVSASGTNPDPTIRMAIANEALSDVGSKKWLDTPGHNKCNEFVFDVLSAAGNAPPKMGGTVGYYLGYKLGISALLRYAPLAGQWADTSINIPNWPKLPGGPSQAQPGDIIAEQINYSDATGHVGIVVGPQQTASADSTAKPPGTITISNYGFRPNTDPRPYGKASNSTVRRFYSVGGP